MSNAVATEENVTDSQRDRTAPGPATRKIVAQVFVSMDGVMQAPGGQEEDRDDGFLHGGWSMTYWDDSMARVMADFMARPHDLLLGRRTYEVFADFWPKHTERPEASSLNRTRKLVASRSKKEFEWENSSALPGDPVVAVQELKRGTGREFHVLGSATFLQSLLKRDLIDELELWVFPVVIGSGKRLFGSGAIPTAWRLTRSQTSGTGVLMHHYERAGEIKYGRPPGT